MPLDAHLNQDVHASHDFHKSITNDLDENDPNFFLDQHHYVLQEATNGRFIQLLEWFKVQIVPWKTSPVCSTLLKMWGEHVDLSWRIFLLPEKENNMKAATKQVRKKIVVHILLCFTQLRLLILYSLWLFLKQKELRLSHFFSHTTGDKQRSVPVIIATISSRDSSATWRLISTSPPAPRPLVTDEPILRIFAPWTLERQNAWASVLMAQNSTPPMMHDPTCGQPFVTLWG